MKTLDGCFQDVMQVCRNGHVITDLLHTFPERALSHCDRCGAVTYDRCLTCGQALAGAVYVPEAPPVGARRPPQYCSACGASFPWTERRQSPHAQGPWPVLERSLRRLPMVARELRYRQGERPAFRVDDEHDLEDLLRAVLPLHFDDVRYEKRTPSYAPDSRTDFRLSPSGIVIASKKASGTARERQLGEQVREDIGYYQQQRGCRSLTCFVYDPERILTDPGRLETAWGRLSDELLVRAVVAS